MGNTYLVDGYNLLFHLGLLDRRAGARALEQARQRLLAFIHETLGSGDHDITVIFDAGDSARRSPTSQEYHGLRVEYASRGDEADDVIEDRIARCVSPHRLIVVSSDHRLREAARRKGTRSWSCEDFLDHRDKKAAAPPPGLPQEPDRSGPTSRDEVRRWLAEFGDIAGDPEFRELFEPYPFEKDMDGERGM